MERSTHKSNLDRIIELAKSMKGNEKSNALVEMVNDADLHQYDLMRDHGLAEFECSAAGGNWHFLSRAHLTERGQLFIKIFGDEDNHAGVKKLAKAQDERLNDLSLDDVMELGTAHLEEEPEK